MRGRFTAVLTDGALKTKLGTEVTTKVTRKKVLIIKPRDLSSVVARAWLSERWVQLHPVGGEAVRATMSRATMGLSIQMRAQEGAAKLHENFDFGSVCVVSCED
jgi:hypothetical protein